MKRSDHVLSGEARRAMAERTDSKPIGGGVDASVAEIVVPSAGGPNQPLSVTMAKILSGCDGWLRIVPDPAGKVLWLKFKFTGGRCAGCYVMVRGEEHEDLAHLFGLLFDKVDWARATGLGVVVDRYFKP